MSEDNNVNQLSMDNNEELENNKKGFGKRKKIILIIAILILITIPSFFIIRKQSIKKFEIKTLANMYVMLEITNDYVVGKIDELEFSNQEGELMKELDKVNPPNILRLENTISTYEASCDMLLLTVLTSVTEGKNPKLSIDSEFDILLDSISVLKRELEDLDAEYNINLKFSEEVEDEVDKLLDKIR